MSNNKYKFKIYEYTNSKGKTFTGTSKEIIKKAGISSVTLYSYGEPIGSRCAEIKAYDKRTKETHYGTVEEIMEHMDIANYTTITNALQRGGNMLKYRFELTGEWLFVPDESYVPKNNRKQVEKPKRKRPVTPMSDYAQQLFEHSTRHLRRDA